MITYVQKLIVVLIAVMLVTSACGKENETAVASPSPGISSTATPSPAPTPSSTPEPTADILGISVPISELEEGYTFELYGQEVNTVTTTRLEYKKQPEIGDEGLNTFREVLPYMYNLEYLSFDRCGTTDEEVSKLREEFRDRVKIVWRVFFGTRFTAMTDAETVWASVEIYSDSNIGGLKYCEDMINLDVGHCGFTDLSFIETMPKLKVLIISCNSMIEDISSVSYCKHLEYLEVAECPRVKDLSPIASCEELEHLNIGCCSSCENFESLYSLKHLKRFYAVSIYKFKDKIDDMKKEVQALMPDCDVNFDFYGPMEGGIQVGLWRFTGGKGGARVPRYDELFKTFGYSDQYNAQRVYVFNLD